nr:unnamed protein product [Callosobruchus analis]
MIPVISKLRSQGLVSVVYLDDFMLFGQEYQDCLNNVETALNLLKNLGFVINREKSLLQPSQSCEFLGFLFNSKYLYMSVPNQKKYNICFILRGCIVCPAVQLDILPE